MAGALDIFLRGTVVVAILALGNLVAAGVLAVLGPLVMSMQDTPLKALAVIVLGTLAVICALIFIKGCIREVAEHLQYPRGHRGG